MTACTRPSILFALCLFFAAVAAGWPAAGAVEGEESATHAAATVIRGARVFTGDAMLAQATVVLRNGRIESVVPGRTQSLPAGADVVDGAGLTLLPGLIDSHTHNYGAALEQALNFGVTTTFDMFTEPNAAAAWRREQAAGEAAARADLFSAGVLVTVKGGHGTQFLPIPTLDDPEQAEAFVAARVAEGSDYIKIVYETGAAMGRPLPTHAPATLKRLVDAAHSHDKLAVFHVSTAPEARSAIDAGADGLMHMYQAGQTPDEAGERAADLLAAAKQAGIFVTPTLAVIETLHGLEGGAELTADARIAPFLDPDQRNSLGRDFGLPARPDAFQALLENVLALYAAGVPILAGSDALNPGTAYGASLHRELELLVAAGLEPSAALRAATAAPADAFGLADRGRIAPGKKADVLLIRGNPSADILATRDIVAIWKDGVYFERRRPDAAVPDRPVLQPGKLSDFEAVTLATLPQRGWQPSTDAMMGGDSTVQLGLVADAAGGTALRIDGEIAMGFPYPWAGAMIGLAAGQAMMQPVDASASRVLRFDARGRGGTFRVLAFAESLGTAPATVVFDANADQWTAVEIALDAFAGLNAKGLAAFLFAGPATPGTFQLDIDNVELKP